MHYLGAFLIELIFLFLLSRSLTVEISRLLYNITKSKKVTIFLLALIFFPGTTVHELSHFSAAKILRVPTGKISLMPELAGDSVKLGSVEIAQKDPVRLFLIGIAPFISGVIIIILLLQMGILNSLLSNKFSQIAVLYGVFVVGNTMFSSKKDMEEAGKLFIFLVIIMAVSYLLGLKVTLPTHIPFEVEMIHIGKTGTYLLLIPLAIDIVIIILAKILHSFLRT